MTTANNYTTKLRSKQYFLNQNKVKQDAVTPLDIQDLINAGTRIIPCISVPGPHPDSKPSLIPVRKWKNADPEDPDSLNSQMPYDQVWHYYQQGYQLAIVPETLPAPMLVYDHDQGDIPNLTPTYHHRSKGNHGGTHHYYKDYDRSLIKAHLKAPNGQGDIIGAGLIFVRKGDDFNNLLNLINALKNLDNFASYTKLLEDFNTTVEDLNPSPKSAQPAKPFNTGDKEPKHHKINGYKFELYPSLAKKGLPRPVIEQILAHFNIHDFDKFAWTHDSYITTRCISPTHEDKNPSMLLNVIPLPQDPHKFRIHVNCQCPDCNKDDLLDELYTTIKDYALQYRLETDTLRFAVYLINLIKYLDENPDTAVHLGTLRSYHHRNYKYSPCTRKFIEAVTHDFNLMRWEIKHKTYYLKELNYHPMQRENLLMSDLVTDPQKSISKLLNLDDLARFDMQDVNTHSTPDSALKLANLMLSREDRSHSKDPFDSSIFTGDSFDFSDSIYDIRTADDIPVIIDPDSLVDNPSTFGDFIYDYQDIDEDLDINLGSLINPIIIYNNTNCTLAYRLNSWGTPSENPTNLQNILLNHRNRTHKLRK